MGCIGASVSEYPETRASLIVDNVGVVGAYINEGLARGMGIYQAQLDELT